MTLLIPAKVLLHVWSYDFYDMTLSTGKQRRHMINYFKTYSSCRSNLLHGIILFSDEKKLFYLSSYERAKRARKKMNAKDIKTGISNQNSMIFLDISLLSAAF